MKRILIYLLLSPACLGAQQGEEASGRSATVFEEAAGKLLRWRLNPGEVVELRKFGEQDVKVNGQPIRRNVFHRVLLEVKGLEPQGYRISGTFRSHIRTESKAKAPYKEEEYYTGDFILKPTGEYLVPEKQYMPNIRHIPAFPPADPADEENPMKPGYRWTAAGEEVMQAGEVVSIPVEVRYEYLGRDIISTEDGLKVLHKIQTNYQINYEASKKTTLLPRRMFGLVQAVWLWDEKESIPYYSQEDYNVLMIYESGETQEYQIKHRSLYRKIKPLPEQQRQELLAELQSGLQADAKAGQPAAQADLTEQGIRITLPDVLFSYNSAELTSQSREVLNRVSAILSRAPERQIRVLGHTDNIGSDEFNKQLSEERARTVANYLAARTKIAPEKISFEGMGEKFPVADNKSEEGRARNRRVEIILLDK